MKKFSLNHYKAIIISIFSVLFLSSCSIDRQLIHSHVKTFPKYPIDPAPTKFLLLNTYDVSVQKFKERKEELYADLLDTVLSGISRELLNRLGINSEIIYGLTKTEKRDSTVEILLKQHNASHALVLTFLDINFEQTHVEVKKDSTGTTREAFYDILSFINYYIYDKDGIFKVMQWEERLFHSSRFVVSGLFAVGPAVAANRIDAINVVQYNLHEYLKNFFPGEEDRTRTIFIGKELDPVRVALAKGDYDSALEESLRLVNHPDNKVAAKANYNCAVFFERNNRSIDAKLYLKQSMERYELPEASSMMNDYGN